MLGHHQAGSSWLQSVHRFLWKKNNSWQNEGQFILASVCENVVTRFLTVLSDSNQHYFTVYPKKYAHGFCFAVLCRGYTLTDFAISIRLTSLALWQSNDCPSASKATLMNMDEYFMWIHYERLHNNNKAKHNKTVCIFLGIYCIWNFKSYGNNLLRNMSLVYQQEACGRLIFSFEMICIWTPRFITHGFVSICIFNPGYSCIIGLTAGKGFAFPPKYTRPHGQYMYILKPCQGNQATTRLLTPWQPSPSGVMAY